MKNNSQQVHHISPEGPRPCDATIRDCKYGEHYASAEEAQQEWDKSMKEESGALQGMRKRFNPHSPAMTRALQEAPLYKKRGVVTVREAKPGEKLETVLADGTVETSRELEGGEIIVRNPGGEEYAMSAEKFYSRYERGEGEKWKATGQVKAVRNPTGKPITIMAPWGEEQHGDEHCFIACDPNNDKDRYIIGAQEFADTYGSEEELSGSTTDHGSLPRTVVATTMKPQAQGRYYGCSVPKESVAPYLEALRAQVGEEEAARMEEAKAARDRGYKYHLTTVGPPEMKHFKKTGVPPLPEKVSIHYEGLGKAVEGDNEAWFIVAKSPEVAAWREQHGLPPKDLHITLGFRGKDVHTQPKGESAIQQR